MSDADWKEVAAAMREEGLTYREIGDRLCRSEIAIRRARQEAVTGRSLGVKVTSIAGRPTPLTGGSNEESFTQRHQPRRIRKLPGNPQLAAGRFAAGEITFEQLSCELRGEA